MVETKKPDIFDTVIEYGKMGVLARSLAILGMLTSTKSLEITKLTKNAAFYQGKCIRRPLV